MKKFLIVLVVLIVLGGLGWFFFLRGDDEPVQEETAQKQNYPVQFDQSSTPVAKTTYASPFQNLSFDYPNNWNVVEGADNSEEKQLLTVESPQDTNEFYFCIDLNLVNPDAEDDFTTKDAQVIASEQLDSGNYAITYKIKDLERLYWGVTSNAVEVGATSFASEISGESGRLQVLGRFNCRETTNVDFSAEHFKNSQWLHEAKAIINSLDI